MDHIRNAKKIIEEAERARQVEQDKIDSEFAVFEAKIDEMMCHIPDESLMEAEYGYEFCQLILEEGLLDALGKGINMTADGYAQLKNGIKSAVDNTFVNSKKFSRFKGAKRKDKAKINQITKGLVRSYYEDYNAVLNAYKQKRKIFSKEFFNTIITTFGLEADVEREVSREFSKPISELIRAIQKEGADAVKELKSSGKKVDIRSKDQLFHAISTKARYKYQTKGNELIGKIIGYAAALSVADYYQSRESKGFSESVSQDLNENYVIDSVTAIRSQQVESAETTVEDSEEETKSIFDMYVKKDEGNS